MKFVLARDIVIPAGTKVQADGPKTSMRGEAASVLIAETHDHTSEWSMPLDEALRLGIVVPA